MKLFTSTGRSEIVDFTSEGLFHILENFSKAGKFYYDFWSFFPYFLLPTLSVAALALIAKLFKRPSLVALVATSFLCLIISTIGFQCLLKEGPSAPRMLSFFPATIMISFVPLIFWCRFLRFLTVLPIMACIIFNYRVGNIHKIQAAYEAPIIFSLAMDINREKEITTFHSIGSLPFSPYVKNLIKYTPFNGFLERQAWRTAGRLQQYVDKDLVPIEWSSSYEKSKERFAQKKESGKLTLLNSSSPFFLLYGLGREGFIFWEGGVITRKK